MKKMIKLPKKSTFVYHMTFLFASLPPYKSTNLLDHSIMSDNNQNKIQMSVFVNNDNNQIITIRQVFLSFQIVERCC